MPEKRITAKPRKKTKLTTYRAQPDEPLDAKLVRYRSPEFTQALTKHFKVAVRAAIAKKAKGTAGRKKAAGNGRG